MIKTSTIKNICIVLMCLSVLLNENTIYMWSTFNEGIFANYIILLRYVSIVLMFFYIFAVEKRRTISLRTGGNVILFSLITIITTGFIVSDSNLFNINRWITFVYVLCFLCMDDKLRDEVLKTFTICFIIFSLPSIIYWLIDIISIDFPHDIVQSTHEGKVQAGFYYKSYPFGVLICNPLSLSRPTGVFDEPGVLGTTAALLFSANLRSERKKTKIALIIIGVFSFSLAFYVLFIIISISKSYIKGARKVAGILCALLVVYFIFEAIPFENSYLSLIQNRLSFADGKLVGLNRTYSSFEREFQEFYHAGGRPLIFGYGYYAYFYNPFMFKAAEIRCLIYDIGILGLFLLVVFFIRVIRDKKSDKYNWCFFIVFLVSMYQRPHILSAMYMLIYICGVSATRKIGAGNSSNERKDVINGIICETEKGN